MLGEHWRSAARSAGLWRWPRRFAAV